MRESCKVRREIPTAMAMRARLALKLCAISNGSVLRIKDASWETERHGKAQFP